MQTLHDKRAVVTGAASGIGRAITRELVRGGATVVAVDVDTGGLESLQHDVATDRGSIEAIEWDLSDPDSLESLAGRLADGGTDLLVNNAGILVGGPTHEVSWADFELLFRVNALAPMRLTQLMLPHLLSRPDPHVMTVSSLLGLTSSRKVAGYSATKHALVGYTRAIRREYGPQGLGVTVVCSGIVRTEFVEKATRAGRFKHRIPAPDWAIESPERVGALAVRGVLRNQEIVVTGLAAKMSWWLDRLSPTLLDRGGKRYRKARRENRSGASIKTLPVPDRAPSRTHPTG